MTLEEITEKYPESGYRCDEDSGFVYRWHSGYLQKSRVGIDDGRKYLDVYFTASSFKLSNWQLYQEPEKAKKHIVFTTKSGGIISSHSSKFCPKQGEVFSIYRDDRYHTAESVNFDQKNNTYIVVVEPLNTFQCLEKENRELKQKVIELEKSQLIWKELRVERPRLSGFYLVRNYINHVRVFFYSDTTPTWSAENFDLAEEGIKYWAEIPKWE